MRTLAAKWKFSWTACSCLSFVFLIIRAISPQLVRINRFKEVASVGSDGLLPAFGRRRREGQGWLCPTTTRFCRFVLPWVSNLQFIHGASSFLEDFLSFPSLLIPGSSWLAVHCSWRFPPCLFCQLYLRQATVPSPQGLR